jgi:hypothetical protein
MNPGTIAYALLVTLSIAGMVSDAGTSEGEMETQELKWEILKELMVWQSILSATVIGVAIFAFNKAYEAKKTAATDYVRTEGAASIEAIRREYEALFAESKGNVSDATAIAYEGARACIQGLHACMDAAVGKSVPKRARAALKRIEIAGAQLQIRFGDNSDVIAGINKLYGLCSPEFAKSAFETGLGREELSGDARETILDRVHDLQRRGGDD